MPRKKAAYKRIRADKKLILRNQSTISEIKTLTKKVRDLIQAKDKKNAEATFLKLVSKIDKAKNKKILHKNTAARLISRIAKKIRSI